MKYYSILALLLLAGCASDVGEGKQLKTVTPVDFSQVKIEDEFWSPRLEKHKNTTLKVCIDQIENKTGRIRNFENAAKGEGKHLGLFFRQ